MDMNLASVCLGSIRLGKRGYEFLRLYFESTFLQIEQTFHGVRPQSAIACLFEQRIRAPDNVDNDSRRSFSPFAFFERRIEFTHKTQIHILCPRMYGQIETWCAHQVQKLG
jgi:hypothetical protein